MSLLHVTIHCCDYSSTALPYLRPSALFTVLSVILLPCSPLLYSLGSATSYRFTNESDGADISSTGWSHVEKNWGSYFPHSHSWMQGTTQDNTVHVCAFMGLQTPGRDLRLMLQDAEMRSSQEFSPLHLSPPPSYPLPSILFYVAR